VTNVVSPLMSNMDRFIVGGLLSVKAVTYYATPFDAVSKVTLLPSSIMGVFFPAFAATHEHELPRTASLFDRSTRLIALATFPALLIVVTFAHTLLALWIGPDYARASTSILQCLALGMYLTSFAYVPFALLQAVGRPDVTAKLHLTELPLYAALIVGLTHGFGLIGVAFAFTARVIFDMALLYWLAGRALKAARPESGRVVMRSAIMATITGAIVCGGAFTGSAAAGIAYASVALATSAFVGWRWVLLADERALVTRAMPAFLRQQTGPA